MDYLRRSSVSTKPHLPPTGILPKYDFVGFREEGMGQFTLFSAYQFLFGNKFLRRLFSDVSEELDEIEIIRPYLLDIVSLLNRADFNKILADFGKLTRTEDPVVHFYETFLAAYDPKMARSRGSLLHARTRRAVHRAFGA